MLDAPGGTRIGEQFTFQMTFRSIEDAVEVAMEVFEQVYHVAKDCPLTVTKGWET